MAASAHKDIERRIALQNRGNYEIFRPFCGKIFHAVHCQIDLAREHELVDLRHEDSDAGKLVQGLIQEDISAGLDLTYLYFRAQRPEPFYYDLCLAQGQRAAPTPYDQLFRQERNASNVVSMTSLECAADMKSVSYWLGVRNMPESSMRRKKAK